MAYEPGFLDRIINPTFGVIQQPLWRIWRAMQDDEIDLMSGKGLLDPHLFPILGMAFDPKNTVMMDDKSLKPIFGESFGGQLAGAVLTDPLTYLTGGLSGAAKMSRRLAKDVSNVATKTVDKAGKEVITETSQNILTRLANASKGNLDEAAELTELGHQGFNKVGDVSFAGLMDEVAKVSKNKGAILGPDGKQLGELATEYELSALQKLQKDMDKFGAPNVEKLRDTSVMDVLGKFNEREMGLGIPLLGDLFGMYTPVNKSFQEWGGGGWMKTYFKTIKKFYTWPIGKSMKITGAVLNPVVSNIPVINKVAAHQTKMVDDFLTGFRQGAEPESMINYNPRTDSLFNSLEERNLYTSGVITDIRDRLAVDIPGVDGVGRTLENSGLDTSSHVTAYMEAIDVTGKGAVTNFLNDFDESARDSVKRLLGLDEALSPELQKEALKSSLVAAVNRSNRAVLEMGQPDIVFSPANYSTSAAMQLGADIKAWHTKLFSNDLGVQGGREAQNHLNRIRSNFTQYTRQVGEDLFKATRKVSLDSGMDPKAVQAFHSAYIGTVPQVDELKVFFKEYTTAQKPLSQLTQEFQEWFGARMNSHLETLVAMNADELGIKGPALESYQTLINSISRKRSATTLDEIRHLEGLVNDFDGLRRAADAKGNISIDSIRGILAEDPKLAADPELHAHVMRQLRIEEYQLYHIGEETGFAHVEGFEFSKFGDEGTLHWETFAGNPKHATFTSDIWDDGGKTLRNTAIGTRTFDELYGLGKTNQITGKVEHVKSGGGIMKQLEAAKSEVAKIDVTKPKKFTALAKRLLGTDTKDPKALKLRLQEVRKQIDADYGAVKKLLTEEHYRKDYTPFTVRAALKANLHPTLTTQIGRIGTLHGKPVKTLSDLPNLVLKGGKSSENVTRTMELHSQIMHKQRALEVWKDLQGTSVVSGGMSGQGIPPAFLLGLEEDIVALGQEMKGMFARVLNGGAETGSGSMLMDLADEIKLNSYRMAVKNDLVGGALPLGYMHRVLSGQENAVITRVYGDLVDAIQGAGMGNSHAMRILSERSHRAMTIGDINTITAELGALRNTSPAVKQVVKVFEGIRKELFGSSKRARYSEDPVASIVGHLSEVHEAITRRKWLEYIASPKGRQLGFAAGKIVGVSVDEFSAAKPGVRIAPETKAALPTGEAVKLKVAKGRIVEIDDMLNATPLSKQHLKEANLSAEHIKEILKLKDLNDLSKFTFQVEKLGKRLFDIAHGKLGVPTHLRNKVKSILKEVDHFDGVKTYERRSTILRWQKELGDIIKPVKPKSVKDLAEKATGMEPTNTLEQLLKERRGLVIARDDLVRSGEIPMTPAVSTVRGSIHPVGADTEAIANLKITGPNQANFDAVMAEDWWQIDKVFDYEGATRARNILKSMYTRGEISEEHVLLMRGAFASNPGLIGKNVSELESWGGDINKVFVEMDDGHILSKLEAGGPGVQPDGKFLLAGQYHKKLINERASLKGLIGLGEPHGIDFRFRDAQGKALSKGSKVSVGDHVQHTLQEIKALRRVYAAQPDMLEKIELLAKPLLLAAQDLQAQKFMGMVGKIVLDGLDEGAHVRNTHGLLRAKGDDFLRTFLKEHYSFIDDAHLEKTIQNPDEFLKVVSSTVFTERGVEAAEAAGLGEYVKRFANKIREFVSNLISKLTLNKRLDPDTTEHVASTINQLVRGVFDIEGNINQSYRMTYSAKRRLVDYNQNLYNKLLDNVEVAADTKLGRLLNAEGTSYPALARESRGLVSGEMLDFAGSGGVARGGEVAPDAMGAFLREATHQMSILQTAKGLASSGRNAEMQKALGSWLTRGQESHNLVAEQMTALHEAADVGFWGRNIDVDDELVEMTRIEDELLSAIDIDGYTAKELDDLMEHMRQYGAEGDLMNPKKMLDGSASAEELSDFSVTLDEFLTAASGEGRTLPEALPASQELRLKGLQDILFGPHRRGLREKATDPGWTHDALEFESVQLGKAGVDEEIYDEFGNLVNVGMREVTPGEVTTPVYGQIGLKKSRESKGFFEYLDEPGTGKDNLLDVLSAQGKPAGLHMTATQFRAHHTESVKLIKTWEDEIKSLKEFKLSDGKARTLEDGFSGQERKRMKELTRNVNERKRRLLETWQSVEKALPQAKAAQRRKLVTDWAKNVKADVDTSLALAKVIQAEMLRPGSKAAMRMAQVKLLASNQNLTWWDINRVQTDPKVKFAAGEVLVEDEWNALRMKLQRPNEATPLSPKESIFVEKLLSKEGSKVNIKGHHPLPTQAEVDEIMAEDRWRARWFVALLKDKKAGLRNIKFPKKKPAEKISEEVTDALFPLSYQGKYIHPNDPRFMDDVADGTEETIGFHNLDKGPAMEELYSSLTKAETKQLGQVAEEMFMKSKASDVEFIKGIRDMHAAGTANAAQIMRHMNEFLAETTRNFPEITASVLRKVEDVDMSNLFKGTELFDPVKKSVHGDPSTHVKKVKAQGEKIKEMRAINAALTRMNKRRVSLEKAADDFWDEGKPLAKLKDERKRLQIQVAEAERQANTALAAKIQLKVRAVAKEITVFKAAHKAFKKDANAAMKGVDVKTPKGGMPASTALKKLASITKDRNDMLKAHHRASAEKLDARYGLNPELISSDYKRVYGSGRAEGLRQTGHNMVRRELAAPSDIHGQAARTHEGKLYKDEVWKKQLAPERRAILNEVGTPDVPGSALASKIAKEVGDGSTASELRASSDLIPDASGAGAEFKTDVTDRVAQDKPWTLHIEDFETKEIREVPGQAFTEAGQTMAVYGAGEDIAGALANSNLTGLEGAVLKGTDLNPERIMQQMLNQHVTIAPENFNRAASTTLALDKPSGMAGLAKFYDNAHGVMKIAATGLRIPLDFHAGNILSSIPQAALEGIGPTNMLQGMLATMRLLSRDATQLGLDDMSVLLQGSKVNPRAMRLPFSKYLTADNLQEIAGTGRRAAGGMPLKGLEDIPEELLFRDAIGRSHTIPEMVMAMMDNGALDSMVRADLQNVVHGDSAVQSLRREFLERAGNKGASVQRNLMNFAEGSELFVRFSAMHGALNAGMDLNTAARAVSEAMINYSDITHLERRYLKRATFFYTYPRKMVPKALGYLFNNPNKASLLINGVLKPLSANENLEVSEGRPEIVMGDYRVNAARINPFVDGITAMGAIADMLFPGIGMDREMKGHAPWDKPISPSPVANIMGWSEFFPMEDPLQVNQEWLEEGRRANWALKLLTGAGPLIGSSDPEVSYTPLEKVAKSVLPYRKVRPGQEAGRRVKRISHYRYEYANKLKSAEQLGNKTEVRVLTQKIDQMDTEMEKLRRANPEIQQ